MLIERSDSLLLVVDVQTALMPVVARGDQAITEIGWLAAVAERLEVPVWVTEQYPQGLGTTEPRLTCALPQSARWFTKSHFNACREREVAQALEAATPRQVVIAGAEAHICVLQTALGLLKQGVEVFWLVEGCVSRRGEEARLAGERARQAGAQLVSADMVAYEWLERCDDPVFREVHRELLRPRASRPLRLGT
ncbi:isochorismatase family protein [Halomonas denitrificans]|uniref:isochorismatase family protein n=1 Tax=Halomonas denitrificans TaxID=370769 RepID=UPI001C98E980|nr:isochorismatase family protein [Halomonas denitrificans]MBY5970055.1 isochorismatase family protein [Halomonas denitrificans]